jgi:hypothetical protein
VKLVGQLVAYFRSHEAVVAFFFFLFLQFFLFRCGMLRFFNARKVPSINVKVSLIIFLHFQSCFNSIMEKFHQEQIPGVAFSSVIIFFWWNYYFIMDKNKCFVKIFLIKIYFFYFFYL